MHTLEGRSILVTGGNRGLGLAIVEALAARKARITVVARDRERLAALHDRLGVSVIPGDVTDQNVVRTVLRDVRPDIVLSNAGSKPVMAPIHEQSWEGFSHAWNTDTRAAFAWVQETLRMPLRPGSRVVLTSSGAALRGSPLSGGYAGAKRMIWLLASYANSLSAELELGIRFQTILPLQMVGTTEHGQTAADAYAHKQGITRDAFLARFGAAMSPHQYAEHVITILTDPAHDAGLAYGIKGESGISSLDGP
jgi:NAD(P)-dependent dehydrogenase (short-subunit alcohol dehydrogenase family)